MKHGRIASHLSSSVVLESDLDAVVPRRKTVGFKDASHRRSELTTSLKGDFDDSKKVDNLTSGIIVDDVESRKSPSIFDRASDDGELIKDATLDASAAVEPSPEKKEMEIKEPLFHPKQNIETEAPIGADQNAPKPTLDQELLAIEDHDAQLFTMSRGPSNSQRVTRERKPSDKKVLN